MNNNPVPGDDEAVAEPPYLAAGNFSSWLLQTRNALITGTGVAVPCGECTACCMSSYFIHIRPEEGQTRARINRKLLFPAPGLPRGNVVMGYDEDGHCPMLVANKCSIYAQRPLTCRAYDCRVFTAAGIDAGDDKAQINLRLQRWRFSYPSAHDREEHAAVQAAAIFLRDHAECFPPGATPRNPSQLAIFAITVYDVFLKHNDDLRVPPASAIIAAIRKVDEEFAARRDRPINASSVKA